MVLQFTATPFDARKSSANVTKRDTCLHAAGQRYQQTKNLFHSLTSVSVFN